MDNRSLGPMHRKRRRRRRVNKSPISAHLYLDERLKGDVGVVSDDLFTELFPGHKNVLDDSTDKIYHAAITPWQPLSILSADATQWTIVPVRRAAKSDASASRAHSSLQFPAHSLGLLSFANNLRALDPNKNIYKREASVEIRITDVVPVGLDTVFVKLDTDALKKLEDVHSKFGGGFGFPSKSKGKPAPTSAADQKINLEKKWREAVRDAIGASKLVHQGDLLPLPLQGHPITHVAPPPAKITSCEPLAQGVVLPSTRIVIVSGKSKDAEVAAKGLVKQLAPAGTTGIPEEDEDTANEQFFSAAEDFKAHPTAASDADPGVTDTEASDDDAEDLSDDPDDLITLDTPSLQSHTSGLLSQAAATPRPGYPNGVSTPGSVFSTSTVRGDGSLRSKTFKAYGLLDRIPDDLLHPKPDSDNDEEARVFVDTASLAKLGCFAGDWVRIEAGTEPFAGLGHWHLGSFDHGDDEPQEWRVARIYALPEFLSQKDNRYIVHKTRDRPTSFLGGMLIPTSQIHLSPITLANLGSPAHIKVFALMTEKEGIPGAPKVKVLPDVQPPQAKEVTLLKLSTPLTTDRTLQPSLFAGLKEFLERKRRVMKSGDMFGIPVDESLGRAVFEGDDGTADEPLLKASSTYESNSGKAATGVAWFKIGELASAPKDNDEDDSMWGGAMSIDASNAKIVQAGSAQGKVPPTTTNTWQYYLGLKRAASSGNRGSSYGLLSTELPSPYVSSLRRRLRELITAATSPRAIHLGLPPVAILLTSTQRNIGKAYTTSQACSDLGLHIFSIDAFDILAEGGDVKTEGFLKARSERAMTCGKEYTALLVKHVEKLDAERMVVTLKEILADTRVLVATTTEVEKVPDGVRALFTHELEMTAPDEAEREGILRGIVEGSTARLALDVTLSSVAVKTAALVAGDLVDVVDRALVARQIRLEDLASAATKSLDDSAEAGLEITVRDLTLAGHSSNLALTTADLAAAVEAARKNFADAIGAPKIPNVQWSDVGGMSHVKSAVIETIQLPLSRPELFAKGMKKRSGILFYGPPGTGKTLLAKAIATEFSLNFFSVKGPELLNMYIGESEANVRRVFQRARDARPCVVFFDELDSVAPKRGNQGDSGGVMDRIVSQLLAELDGMSGSGEGEDGSTGGGQGVFVIGATNRPDLLDQALLRPGRFDKMLYLGVNDTHEGQLKVLEALTRKFTLHPSLSLKRIASTLPFTYTGADLYALCSDAMLKAITRQARNIDTKVARYNASQPKDSDYGRITIAYFFDHLASDEDIQVTVQEEDFENARKELVPSVSKDELSHYERVRKAFEGNTKPKGDALKQEGQPSLPLERPNTSSAASVAAGAGKSLQLGPPMPEPDHPQHAGGDNPRLGSWLKMKDRIKQRSMSRGHGGNKSGALSPGLADRSGGSSFASMTSSRSAKASDLRSQTSSESPSSVYKETSGSSLAEEMDDEDNFTSRGKANGTLGSVRGKPKSKGKGKADEGRGGFGDAAKDDDDMYT